MRHHAVTGPVIVSLLVFMIVILTGGAGAGIASSFQADRSLTGAYRTTPLKGLWTHQKGGFYHDGRFAGLHEVVAHYNGHFRLGLTDAEVKDLIEHLKAL